MEDKQILVFISKADRGIDGLGNPPREVTNIDKYVLSNPVRYSSYDSFMIKPNDLGSYGTSDSLSILVFINCATYSSRNSFKNGGDSGLTNAFAIACKDNFARLSPPDGANDWGVVKSLADYVCVGGLLTNGNCYMAVSARNSTVV